MEKERLSKKRVGAAAPGPAEDGTGGWCVFFFGGGVMEGKLEEIPQGFNAQVVWEKNKGLKLFEKKERFYCRTLSLCDGYFATEKWRFFQ